MGTTVQNLWHYYQMYKAKNFVMYDHGAKENLQRYGQEAPPAYPLERISTRFALFSSEGDVMADKQDVADLISRLGSNVILHHVVPEKTFGHVDFAIGYNANKFLHNVSMDLIERYATQMY
ncbi:gastric triacylglycerol lipase [Rhipicephalus sanguineus]|nr:gastric triacylglycerol lipase [Rhipicephalus sanguineus]